MEANQGNPEALVKFINQIVSSEGINVADCTLNEGRLNLILEGLDIPSQERTIKLISKALKNLKLPDRTTVYIEGRKIGNNSPDWNDSIELIQSEDKKEPKTNQKRVKKKQRELAPEWLIQVPSVLSGWHININRDKLASFLGTKPSNIRRVKNVEESIIVQLWDSKELITVDILEYETFLDEQKKLVKKSNELGGQSIFGVILMIVGTLFLINGFTMNTTVSSRSSYGRVHNIGLMQEQDKQIMLGGILFIGGAVLYGLDRRNKDS